MGNKQCVHGWLMDMVSNQITASNSKYGGVLVGRKNKIYPVFGSCEQCATRIVISIVIIKDEV